MTVSRTLGITLGTLIAAGAAGAALLPAPFALATAAEGGKGAAGANKVVSETITEKTMIRIADGDGKRETIRFESLAPGESRALLTESGQPVTVRRDGDTVVVLLDGRETRVTVPVAPVPPVPPVPKGETVDVRGETERKIVIRREGSGGAAGATVWTDVDGQVHDIDVERELSFVGGDDVIVLHGGGGRRLAATDLDSLESLRGADAKTKATVKAVLEELDRRGAAATRKVVRRELSDTPGADEKSVEVIVIREEK